MKKIDTTICNIFTPIQFLDIITRGHAEKYAFHGEYKEVELIILAGCSRGMRDENTENGVLDKDTPNFRVFDKLVPNEDTKILLIANCCEQYNNFFIKALKDRYPHAKWLAPEHEELGENIWPETLFKVSSDIGVITKV